jgi:hypothetical protein
MRLLAAHARGERGRSLAPSVPLWFRLAMPASAAAALVLAVGMGVSGGTTPSRGGSGSEIAMVAHDHLQAPASVAMRVVDDPSIALASMGAGSGRMPVSLVSWSAEGMSGPPDGP